jgi:uncharacterized protein (UPF0333 family)
MLHKKLNQKGFSAVEGLLILIIILLVGFIGYYVWHTQKTTDKTIDTASNATKSSPAKSSSQQKFLSIKEWGVKLKLNTSNSDAYYTVVPGQDNEVYISSKALDTFGAQHAECSGVNRSVIMSRLKPGDDNVGSPWTDQELAQAGTKVRDYYYVINTGLPCSGDDTNTVNDLANQVQAIRVKLPNDKDVVAS